jgi:hypothetical protein
MLQIQLSLINNHLNRIFQACLIFGYTPKAWRQAEVVFIPKPGKDSYEKLSSLRPIVVVVVVVGFLFKFLSGETHRTHTYHKYFMEFQEINVL